MKFIEDIIDGARSYERFFQKKLDQRVYDRIRNALTPFSNLGESIENAGLAIVVIPFMEDSMALRRNADFMFSLSELADNSAYHISRMLSGLNGESFSEDILGGYHGRLVMSTDDQKERTFQHEVFHFVLEKLLNDSAVSRVENMHSQAARNGNLVDKRQRQDYAEYFSFGGENYLRNRRILSPNRRLRRKDPELFELVQGILAGKESLLRTA